MPIDSEQIPDFEKEADFLVRAVNASDDWDEQHRILRMALVKTWNARGRKDVTAVAHLLGASGAGAAVGAVSAPQAARAVQALDINQESQGT